MKGFLDSIKERAAAAKAALANTSELQRLEGVEADAKAAWQKFANPLRADVDPPRLAAHAKWTEAGQALESHRAKLDDARDTIRRCAPMLSAHADLASAHREYATARADQATALSEVANLENLIGELNGEVAELADKIAQAMANHSAATVAARLSGQPSPQTAKSALSLNVDLESRRATLLHAETMLSAAQDRRTVASQCAQDAADGWKAARAQVAAIEYHQALADIAPVVAQYLATQSGYPAEVKFAPGEPAIQAARDLLAAELSGAHHE